MEAPHGFRERVAVFLSVLVASGGGAIFAESLGTPTFDETAITVVDPRSALVTGG